MSHGRIIPLAAALAMAWTSLAAGQVTPGELDQLNQAIGQRVESTVILATANSLTTGAYTWNLDNTDVDITNLTWEFDIGDKHPIGQTGLQYMWSSEGGAGFANYRDQFVTGPLVANEERFQSYPIGESIGPRIFFTDDISVLTEAGLIYGYTVNEFDAVTIPGQIVVDDSLVNWHAQTLTFTPSIQLQYERTFFGVLHVRARSNFAYYVTGPIERSTDAWSFRSSSEVWDNGIDLDYNTGIRLLGCEMHLGSSISRTDLFDGIETALDTSHYYNIAGRLMFDTSGKLWILSQLGLGTSYTWGEGFRGYDFGVVLGISF